MFSKHELSKDITILLTQNICCKKKFSIWIIVMSNHFDIVLKILRVSRQHVIIFSFSNDFDQKWKCNVHVHVNRNNENIYIMFAILLNILMITCNLINVCLKYHAYIFLICLKICIVLFTCIFQYRHIRFLFVFVQMHYNLFYETSSFLNFTIQTWKTFQSWQCMSCQNSRIND